MTVLCACSPGPWPPLGKHASLFALGYLPLPWQTGQKPYVFLFPKLASTMGQTNFHKARSQESYSPEVSSLPQSSRTFSLQTWFPRLNRPTVLSTLSFARYDPVCEEEGVSQGLDVTRDNEKLMFSPTWTLCNAPGQMQNLLCISTKKTQEKNRHL